MLVVGLALRRASPLALAMMTVTRSKASDAFPALLPLLPFLLLLSAVPLAVGVQIGGGECSSNVECGIAASNLESVSSS